jgi:hypothetical protein
MLLPSLVTPRLSTSTRTSAPPHGSTASSPSSGSPPCGSTTAGPYSDPPPPRSAHLPASSSPPPIRGELCWPWCSTTTASSAFTATADSTGLRHQARLMPLSLLLLPSFGNNLVSVDSKKQKKRDLPNEKLKLFTPTA